MNHYKCTVEVFGKSWTTDQSFTTHKAAHQGAAEKAYCEEVLKEKETSEILQEDIQQDASLVEQMQNVSLQYPEDPIIDDENSLNPVSLDEPSFIDTSENPQDNSAVDMIRKVNENSNLFDT